VTTLSHLSPDVLEVVRDVAKQEDSFLLRAQGVPLRAFTSENAPLRESPTMNASVASRSSGATQRSSSRASSLDGPCAMMRKSPDIALPS
jgi:hypothetical protein